jgi:hypothetical protein
LEPLLAGRNETYKKISPGLRKSVHHKYKKKKNNSAYDLNM